MAKVTSSADRSKRAARSKATVSGKTPSSRVNRSAVSKAKVTSSSTRSKRVAAATKDPFKVTGRAGRPASTGSAPVTTGRGGLKPAGNFRAPSVPKALATAAKGSSALSKLAKAGVLGTAVAVGINAGSVADGTLKGKPMAKAKPKGSKAENATKDDFGKSFKAARAQGSKEFMFKGKRYNTKRKDGK